MEIKTVKISKLIPHPKNPRIHPDSAIEKLTKSIKEFGWTNPILVSKDNFILAGHARLKAAERAGLKEVPVIYLPFEGSKAEAYMIADNKIQDETEWDFPKLKDLLQELDTGEFDIEITGFDENEIENLMTQFFNIPNNEHIKLKDKFIIPPFSIFDTRQGYWQDRKRAWMSLGIKSEIGRDNSLTYKGQNRLNQILGSNFESGTSIFDPVLCEVCYKWFCVDGGLILDPFAGGSVRGIVANYMGYNYIGIDLSKEQIDANIIQANSILKGKIIPTWIVGNSLHINNLVKDEVDFIFSCPPYFDLEKYSNNISDLSNLSWEDFKYQYKEIINKTLNLLKDDRFACFVVSEIRDNKGHYRGFVEYTKKCFLDNGLIFYNDMVLINAVGTLPIRVDKYFKNRKVGKIHQNVLIFYKGNVDKIKENYGELDIEDFTDFVNYNGV